MENNNNTQNLLVADFDMALIAEFFKGVIRDQIEKWVEIKNYA